MESPFRAIPPSGPAPSERGKRRRIPSPKEREAEEDARWEVLQQPRKEESGIRTVQQELGEEQEPTGPSVPNEWVLTPDDIEVDSIHPERFNVVDAMDKVHSGLLKELTAAPEEDRRKITKLISVEQALSEKLQRQKPLSESEIKQLETFAQVLETQAAVAERNMHALEARKSLSALAEANAEGKIMVEAGIAAERLRQAIDGQKFDLSIRRAEEEADRRMETTKTTRYMKRSGPEDRTQITSNPPE